MLYALYVVGGAFACWLPRKFCYRLARAVADVYSVRSPRDFAAVKANLESVLGSQVSDEQVKEVFRSFAMYLVDFFRFGYLTKRSLGPLVRFEGLENMEKALHQGKGVVGVTAHIGNYELAGAVLSLLGMPVYGVALTHQNPRVDRFFSRQRSAVGVHSIPIQKMSRKKFLESCLQVLRKGCVLGLVADRDYFNRGISMPMFGKTFRLPTGPAWFSVRTGAPVVPCFLVREPDGNFRMITEKPLQIPQGTDEEQAVKKLTEEWSRVLSGVIRRYPTQWYMFQEFWGAGAAIIR